MIKEDSKSTELIKPLLKGREIDRYKANWNRLWLIDTHNGYGDIPPINVEKYKAIKRHLDKFYSELERRRDKGITPYNLRNCAYHEEFEKEKVVWGNIAYDNSFALLGKGMYLVAPGNIITSDNINLKYLLGCLNSSTFNYEFKQKGIFLGNAFEWKKQYVEQVNIPRYGAFSSEIEALVDEILKVKKRNINADTSTIEKEIDQMIYSLYGFSKDEKKIVENVTKIS